MSIIFFYRSFLITKFVKILLFISFINSFIVIALSFYNKKNYVEGSYFQKYRMNFDLKYLPKEWVKGYE